MPKQQLNNLAAESPAPNQRESFIFYRSFKDAIDELSARSKLTIYEAIANYALDRTEPKVDSRARLAWLLIKPQLDANWRKYDQGCQGGRIPKKNNTKKITEKEPRRNRDVTETEPNVNDNVNVNENDNANANANISDDGVDLSLPPVLSDIRAYIATNSLSVEADSFYDYYASNGWIIGSNPMVDWRAALRSWSRKAEPSTNTNQQITLSNDL